MLVSSVDLQNVTEHAALSCFTSIPQRLDVWCVAGMCSAAVAALIALITPLPYSADFRPYFTIHDPAFVRLAAQELPSNTNGLPRVLGVTNLYFLKVSGLTAPLQIYPRLTFPAVSASTLETKTCMQKKKCT